MNPNHTFGQMIKSYRQTQNLTQKKLAEQVNCATITIRRIEANTLRPSPQLAEILAEALAVPPNEKETFISMARSNPGADKLEEESMNFQRNKSIRESRLTPYLLIFLPLFIVLLILGINPNYFLLLAAYRPPFVIAGILPWGWVVLLLLSGLIWLTWKLLHIGYRQGGTWSGPVLLFLTLPTILIILIAPAVLQVFRSGVLN